MLCGFVGFASQINKASHLVDPATSQFNQDQRSWIPSLFFWEDVPEFD